MSKKKIVAGILLLGLLLAGAIPVLAYSVENSGYTYADPNVLCTSTLAAIDQGSGGGLAAAHAQAKQSTGCLAQLNRPSGYLKTKADLWKYDTTYGWIPCSLDYYHYNSYTTWSLTIEVGFGSSTPCGDGHYSTWGYGYQDNGGWLGGALWSGSLYIPS